MKIDSSRKAYLCFQKSFATDIEEFWIASLGPQLELLEKRLLFRGTADRCLIHPRDMVRAICLQNATSFVVAHNHPSGNLRPSRPDIHITKKIFTLSRLLEIPMNDHLIVGKDQYFSFADSGYLGRFSNNKSLCL
jgi:DNA repair protein RadC